ncbi:hypothetical protein ACVWYP_006180 [Bradyrhizobium sp. USDA 3262]
MGRRMIEEGVRTGRQWIYWDRGYNRRVFATFSQQPSPVSVPKDVLNRPLGARLSYELVRKGILPRDKALA